MNQHANLAASPLAENLFCADLCIIRDRVWLILGNGKTEAAAIAANHDPLANLGQDCIALQRDGDRLAAGFYSASDSIVWHGLDVVAYCFNSAETAKTYQNKLAAMLEVNPSAVALLASNAPYPPAAASQITNPQQRAQLEDANRRWQRFTDLTKAVVGTAFVIVPYMYSAADKAALYREYQPGQPVTPVSHRQEA